MHWCPFLSLLLRLFEIFLHSVLTDVLLFGMTLTFAYFFILLLLFHFQPPHPRESTFSLVHTTVVPFDKLFVSFDTFSRLST